MRKLCSKNNFVLSILGVSLLMCLTACGKSGTTPAGQPTVEVTAASAPAVSDLPAETTTSPDSAAESPATALSSRNGQITETTLPQPVLTDETTALTEPTQDVTAASELPESSVLTSVTVLPEHVRIEISAEEIMQAAGIPMSDMMSGVLDVENTEADSGSIMVTRDRPWNDTDGTTHPDWLYRVTSIAVDGVQQGQTVTVTGTAVYNECDWSTEGGSWYAARRVPFTITCTAGIGN